MPTFRVREPDVAYVGTSLYLPKTGRNVLAIKNALEFPVTIGEETGILYLWEETSNHIVVPRFFLTDEQFDRIDCPVVDLTPKRYPRVRFRSKVVLDKLWPDKQVQRPAFAAWAAGGRGIINLSCGKGKTVMALHCIAHTNKPALIIVGQSTILTQWKERIEELLEFDGGIGTMQGNPNTWDWEQPITIAMMQSLSRYPDAVTPAMRKHFGSIWWDEVHHLSAPTFCITATMFPGDRYGLSATLNREDGMDPIFFYHVGRPFYMDLHQDVEPEIFFRETPFTVDVHDPEVFEAITDKNGNPNLGKLRSYMGTREDRILYQNRDLLELLDSGRKVLALSHSRDQLEMMHEMWGPEVSGLCTGKVDVKRRWDALKNKQLIFGTHQLVLEAIDENTLDTLVWLTPFGSKHPEGGVNALQQGMGRIQRYLKGKRTPRVLIYDDIHVMEFHRMCNKLRWQLRNWPEEKGGPYRPVILNMRRAA